MTDTFNDRNMATRNPFIISGRIPDEFFCDRVDESRYLINKIEGQASNILVSNDYGMTDGSCRCVIEESP